MDKQWSKIKARYLALAYNYKCSHTLGISAQRALNTDINYTVHQDVFDVEIVRVQML